MAARLGVLKGTAAEETHNVHHSTNRNKDKDVLHIFGEHLRSLVNRELSGVQYLRECSPGLPAPEPSL